MYLRTAVVYVKDKQRELKKRFLEIIKIFGPIRPHNCDTTLVKTRTHEAGHEKCGTKEIQTPISERTGIGSNI
jgi:hypothetical protein